MVGRPEFGLSDQEVHVAEMGTIIRQFKGKMQYEPGVQGREPASNTEVPPRRGAPADVSFDWPGFKVQRIHLPTGAIRDFLANRHRGPATAHDGGGLERPLQLEWGPDGALYIVDFGIIPLKKDGHENPSAHWGNLWRVQMENNEKSRQR